jgi:GntR family transcriptional regulator
MSAGVRTAAYRTLAAEIRDAIRNGEYADGRQLPTEEQLSASFSVSRQTVRRAMQDLVSEGIIYRVAGRGTYPVAEQDRYVNHFGSVEELMDLSLDTEFQVVTPLQRRVDVETASRLRLSADEIFTAAFIRLHADVPFCYTSVYLPPRIGHLLTGVDELASPGLRSRVTVIGLIDSRMTGSIATAEQSISAAGAPEVAARHLSVRAGEPLLRIDRLYFDADGDPVELAISYFDPEHYSYRVKLRRRSPLAVAKRRAAGHCPASRPAPVNPDKLPDSQVVLVIVGHGFRISGIYGPQ